MISIGTLKLHLPPEYAPRAAGITQCLGEELSRLTFSGQGHWERLRLGPLVLPLGATDQGVAGKIAAILYREIRRVQPNSQNAAAAPSDRLPGGKPWR